MKAEYIEFNGEWHKDCHKCGSYYASDSIDGLALHFFVRDKYKVDGLDAVCKRCRKEYRQKNKKKILSKWKEYYAPGTDARKRHVVRGMTRRKHGSAKLRKCNSCDNQAEEWHHLSYKVDDVIPLCHTCHERV